MSPRIFVCNGQPHEFHAKVQLSKCNFLTRCGLDEICVMIRKVFDAPSEKMGYIFDSQKYFYVTYVMHYMIITYFYSLKIFSCKGVLSKDCEYVPLQPRSSHRFQDSARDSADLVYWAL